jgi:hypothetical protein
VPLIDPIAVIAVVAALTVMVSVAVVLVAVFAALGITVSVTGYEPAVV